MASSSATLCQLHAGATAVPFTFTEEEQIIPSPPPPTPSNHSLSTSETDAFLSHLLTRLSLPPPTLAPVLPLRSKHKTLSTPPVISLREPNKEIFLSAATELGFFHVSDHDIPSHLHETYLQNYRSKVVVPETSDLGCRGSDDKECIHMFEPDSGDEFARELERVGLKVLEFLFEERGIGTETRCSMCVLPDKMEKSSMEKAGKEHLQRCIVQLTYEGRDKKVPTAVVDDSGKRVLVEAREEVVLVTIGEVAQVWSNGRFKKVRSLPQSSQPSLHQSKETSDILVTLLITVPEEASTVIPFVPTVQDANISS